MSLEMMERDYEQFADSEQPVDKERFAVADDSQADWCLRKICALEAAKAKRAEFADAEMKRLMRWQQERDEADQKSCDYFKGLLWPYFAALRAAGKLGKKKSWSLPHGSFGVRAAAAKLERIDDVVIAWAQANAPEHVQQVPKLDWAGLKKRLTITPDRQIFDSVSGCQVEGVRVVEPEREEFRVTPLVGGE